MKLKIYFRLLKPHGQEGRNHFQLQQPDRAHTERGRRAEYRLGKLDSLEALVFGTSMTIFQEDRQSNRHPKMLNAAYLHTHLFFSFFSKSLYYFYVKEAGFNWWSLDYEFGQGLGLGRVLNIGLSQKLLVYIEKSENAPQSQSPIQLPCT